MKASSSLFTDNRNQQILQALLKKHGVKRIIASPGGTNPALVMSFQLDEDFEMYSCVDERSAAYMACGMSEESGEPVAICCTGATASRNYYPALTEAYYRKLPIVVLTCSKPNIDRGHLYPQVTFRDNYPSDVLIDGENLQVIKDEHDAWDCEFKINKTLLEMRHHGGGPVHFNIESVSQECTTKNLPEVHVIHRIIPEDIFPEMKKGRIGIFIGSHKMMSQELINEIDVFCSKYNAVVFSDHTSGYYGCYSIPFSLIATQRRHDFKLSHVELLIHIGEPSGDYLTMNSIAAKNVWRISEDGKIRIRFKKLDYVFEMGEKTFFNYYNRNANEKENEFYIECTRVYKYLYDKIPELPLSLIYVAYVLSPRMPKNCVLHLAIINSLRAWNFFDLDRSIKTNSNVGGFGIDGCTSSLIGASLVDSQKLYFLITGDLAFFYDLNSLGNRHLGANVRILLLNDGKGAEFTHFMAPKYAGDRNSYIAGAGHFGNQSKKLVKDYAEDLGFVYYQATTKEEFLESYNKFVDPKISDKPIFFEILTSERGQSDAWELLCNIAEPSNKEMITDITNNVARTIVPKSIKTVIKKVLK